MKKGTKFKLVLGSKSPRRKELLGHLNIAFDILVSSIEEKSDETLPSKIAEDIATQKGKSVLDECIKEKNYDSLVVGADTIVCYDDEILGKPKDVNDARKMLEKLSGQTHEVVTAVWLGRYDEEQKKSLEHVFHCSTKVHFKKIDEDLLSDYLKSGDSLDKAGAYGIQGQSLTFIDHLEGSYSNVVGFPLDMFIEQLKCFLGHPKDTQGEWRKHLL